MKNHGGSSCSRDPPSYYKAALPKGYPGYGNRKSRRGSCFLIVRAERVEEKKGGLHERSVLGGVV